MNGVKGDWKADILALVESGEVHVHQPKSAKMIDDIRDQSNCGCCWAFGGAEAASDRMCISTKGKIMLPLSAEDVCFCASADGCDGGDISTPWTFIKQSGAVSGGQYHGTGPF